ncbi:hypothetical protein SE19_00055, partial [Acidiplasma aeolicum]
IYMVFVIISDDLTGASGMASMLNNSITVPYYNIKLIDINAYDYVCVDLETRNADVQKSIDRFKMVLKFYCNETILLRIDSALRGNIKAYLMEFSKMGKIIITDTIPEYGRYTEDKKTFYRGDFKNLMDFIPENRNITIMDSRNYNDIKMIAYECVKTGSLPVDPGILIKTYLTII